MRRLLTPAVAAAALIGLAPVANAAPEHHCDATGASFTYVVLYPPGAPHFVAEAELRHDCGSLVAYYPEIGVAVAGRFGQSRLRRPARPEPRLQRPQGRAGVGAGVRGPRR
jgi:hypothetical protein